MITRCKVLCMSSKKVHAGGWYTDPKSEFLYEAEFCAVTGPSPENKRFFVSTPTLTLTVKAVNGDIFVPGKEYYLDFTEAPKPEPVTT